MKKIIICLLAFLLVMLMMTSCSSKNEQSSIEEPHEAITNAPENKAQYEADFNEIVKKLTSLVDDAALVAEYNILIWQEAGPSNVNKQSSL